MIHWELVPDRDFDRLSGAWDDINRANTATALLESRFVALLLRHFRQGPISLALGREGNNIVAMTLCEATGRGTWSTFQPDQAPLGLWLIAPHVDPVTAARALLRRLPGLAWQFGVMQQDPDIAPTPGPAPDVRTLDYIRTARVHLTGTFDAYWEARGKNLRHNLRRQRNRLDREGISPHLEIATEVSAMARAVSDYGRLESAGWKAESGTAIAADNVQGQFYRALLETYARTGDAVAYRYFYNDRLVATDLCVRGNGIINWLKTTYDETQQTSSPAALLRQESFKVAFDDPGLRLLEFYGPVKDWHTKWADEARTMYQWNLYRAPWMAAVHEYIRTRRAATGPSPDDHSRIPPPAGPGGTADAQDPSGDPTR